MLRNLDVLKISGPVSDLGPLADLDELEVVALHGSKISDLGPLVGSLLSYLTVITSPLSDLGPLADAATLASKLPIMCDLDMTISWDQGECAPDGLRCGFSDP